MAPANLAPNARRPAPEEIEQAILKIDPQQILTRPRKTIQIFETSFLEQKIDLGALEAKYSADSNCSFER